MAAQQKIRAADAQAMDPEERRAAQEDRANAIAQQFAGPTPSRNLVRSLLSLVEADEKPDPPEPRNTGPSPGARRVLKRKNPAVAVPEDALW
jgi:hypothetical protein